MNGLWPFVIPVQMEDIEKLLDTVEGDPKVTRRIRSEMDKEEEEVVLPAQAAAGTGAAAEEEEGTRLLLGGPLWHLQEHAATYNAVFPVVETARRTASLCRLCVAA